MIKPLNPIAQSRLRIFTMNQREGFAFEGEAKMMDGIANDRLDTSWVDKALAERNCEYVG